MTRPSTGAIDVREVFLLAAFQAADVVATPQVAECWSEPSSLAQFTVGGLAGHAYLAARIVDHRLDASISENPTLVDFRESYDLIRVDDEADLNQESHLRVRQDGEYVARRGAAAVAMKFRELLDHLGSRLAAEPTDRMITASKPGCAVLLDDFLAIRTVEMLVHADDLTVSVGLAPIDMHVDAATVAMVALIGQARYRNGDLAVLRALTRKERQGSDVLRSL
jgi:Mycothiol maleylpyruvate isomerase N-terminal domain